jgi:hypothetical protein
MIKFTTGDREAMRESITDEIYELVKMMLPEGQEPPKEVEEKIMAIHHSLSHALGIPRVKEGEQI